MFKQKVYIQTLNTTLFQYFEKNKTHRIYFIHLFSRKRSILIRRNKIVHFVVRKKDKICAKLMIK